MTLNTRLVYVNYWSRVRPEAKDIEKEYNKNIGKIVTKPVLGSEYTYNAKSLSKVDFVVFSKNAIQMSRKPEEEKYTSFKIPKRSGGFRTIEAPCDELKTVQQEMVKALEATGWLHSNNAHGFVKNRNCKTSVQVHQKNKSRWFLKMDIHDFFGSTTKEMIKEAFNENSRLCEISEYRVNSILDICTKNGVLPQGAPTSPIMCNIVMNKYDYYINRYCAKHGLVYTRYADDILISSRVKWDYKETVEFIKETLNPYTISENKTRFGSFNGRNWNLGMMYTNDYKITVGHHKKHILKCAVHNFCTKEETRSLETYYNLMGQLAYCKYIEPDYEWFKWAETEMLQYKPTTN